MAIVKNSCRKLDEKSNSEDQQPLNCTNFEFDTWLSMDKLMLKIEELNSVAGIVK
jgi:hypothetical protein